MAQTFIKDIEQRNQRVFMIDGKYIPYILNKMPNKGDVRGKPSAGSHGIGQPISKHDQFLYQRIYLCFLDSSRWPNIFLITGFGVKKSAIPHQQSRTKVLP